ncbi:MAG: aminoacetone oxidase family FAD-binding enzyme [Bacilli bacterium]
METKLIIVGGGAAGIICAITAKKQNPQLQITILEQNDRVGKKILKTGNGKCNISNLNMKEEFYNHPMELRNWQKQLSVNEILSFFRELGLFLKTDGSTRVYPYSEQATSVLELLRFELARLQIEVICNVEVIKMSFIKKWIIETNQRDFESDIVVMATGSLAQEKTNGYQILSDLGHRVIPLHPGLVAMKTKEKLRNLQGLRVKCQAQIFDEKNLLHQDIGEILFKEDGLSGILAFDLSRFFTGKNIVSLDLMYDHPNLEEELNTVFQNKSYYDGLMGILPKMLVLEILKRVSEPNVKRIAEIIHNLTFEVIDTYGWDFAQIACGGVNIKDIADDFSSKKQPQLFIVGELLDIDGASGGYNLHFAWISGILAGRAIARF